MRFRRNKKGFTLVELIVVIAILAILAAVATVSITGIVNNASKNAIRSDLARYKEGYDLYKTEDDSITLNEFKAYIHPSTGTYQIAGSDAVTYGTWTTDATRTVSVTVRGFTGVLNVVTGVVTGL